MKQIPVALKPRSIITVARFKLALAGRGRTGDVRNGCMPATNRVLKDKCCYRHLNDRLALNGKTPRRLQPSFAVTTHHSGGSQPCLIIPHQTAGAVYTGQKRLIQIENGMVETWDIVNGGPS